MTRSVLLKPKMYYSSKDSVKDELKWKKALQRRLLDSGHDDSSRRILAIIAFVIIVLTISLAAINYAVNRDLVSSVVGINNVNVATRDSIVIVPVAPKKMDAAAVHENIETAEEEENLKESEKQNDTGDLPVISQKQIQDEDNEVQVAFQKASSSAPVVLFSKSFCPFCTEIKKVLLTYNKNSDGEKVVNVIELDRDPNGRMLLDGIEQIVGRRSVPQTFISGTYFGGLRAVKEAEEAGELEKLIAEARIAFKNSQTSLEVMFSSLICFDECFTDEMNFVMDT